MLPAKNSRKRKLCEQLRKCVYGVQSAHQANETGDQLSTIHSNSLLSANCYLRYAAVVQTRALRAFQCRIAFWLTRPVGLPGMLFAGYGMRDRGSGRCNHTD